MRQQFRIIITLSCFVVCWTLVSVPSSGAILSGGQIGDEQTSIGYDPATGEVFVDAPLSTSLTSIRISSANSIFTGDSADHLNLSPTGFDIDDVDVIFKSTLGSSFGSLSFGNVAQPGLAYAFLLEDFEVIGSLAGGGDLGAVDLVSAIPEPSTLAITLGGAAAICLWRAQRVSSLAN